MTATDALFFIAPQGETRTLVHAGMERLLNGAGYFVEFGDSEDRPAFVASHAWRWRLRRIVQPAETLQVYANPNGWVRQATAHGAPVTTVAENIVALVVLPEGPATGTGAPAVASFSFASRDATVPATLHRLPARVRLVLAAIDATSAERLAVLSGSGAPALVDPGLFADPARLDADLATLDASLTSRHLAHRFFERTVQIPAAEVSAF